MSHRPHILVPPDLQIILDQNDAPILLKGTSGTILTGRVFPPEFRQTLYPTFTERFPEHIPEGTWGITTVSYISAADTFTTGANQLAYGDAFLNESDIFSEPVGISLATLRAVRGLIEQYQPINAKELTRRIYRWLVEILEDEQIDTIPLDLSHTVQHEWDRLVKAASKCRK